MKKKSSPLKKGDISVNKRSSSAKPKKQPLAESDESEIIGPGSGGGFHLSPRALSMSSVQSGSGVQGGNSSSGSPDLDIDSDNTNAFGGPDRSQDEDDIEDDPSLPGKILTVNDGDTDENGVPNFADGIDVFGNEDGNGGRFVPLVLQIAKPFDDDSIRINFSYSASDPAGVSRQGNADDGYEYSPGGGLLRIWKKDGSSSRLVASAAADGDFVQSGVDYTPSQLGFAGETDTVTLYLEAIAITPSLADADGRRITVETTRITGEDAPQSLGKDSVLVSVFSTKLVKVTGDSSTVDVTDVEVSHAAPQLQVSTLTLSNVRPSADGSKVLARLTISGSLQSALCNQIEGASGTISEVRVFINNSEDANIVIPTNPNKTQTPQNSLLNPYPFSATFSYLDENFEVPVRGNTSFVVKASDPAGFSGYTEKSITVSATPPAVTLGHALTVLPLGTHSTTTADVIRATLAVRDTPSDIPTSDQQDLTETGPNTGIFQNAGGTFQVALAVFPDTGGSQYSAWVTHDGFEIDQEYFHLTGGLISGELTGQNLHVAEENEFTDWKDWAMAVSDQTTFQASTTGELNTYLVQLIGPPEVLDDITQVQMPGGNRFVRKAFNDQYYICEANDVPTALQFRPADDQTPTALGNTLDFLKGFGKGFWAGGVDMVTGVYSIAKFAIVQSFRFSIPGFIYVMATGGNYEKEKQFFVKAKGFVEAAAQIMLKIQADQNDIIEALLVGDLSQLEVLSEEYAEYFNLGIEVLEQLLREIPWDNAEEKGYTIGRVTFEVVMLLLPPAKASHLSKVSFLTKLRTLRVFQSGKAKVALDALEGLLDGMRTTKMCFLAGTPVHTEAGPKEIEKIAVGDSVWSRDERNGREGFKRVTDKIVTHPETLCRITYIAGTSMQKEELTCTPQHPLYVSSRSRFVGAGELAAGDMLLQADGSLAQVTSLSVEQRSGPSMYTTYNLAIDDFHTYFVGNAGIWAHNEAQACERIFAAYWRYRNKALPGETPYETLLKVKARYGTLAKKLDPKAWRLAAKEVNDQMFSGAANGTIPLNKLPSYKDWRDNFNPGLGSSGPIQATDLHVHHAVEKFVQRKLDLDSIPGWDVDLVPGYVMKGSEHTSGQGTLANVLWKEIGPMPKATTNAEKLAIATKVRDIYLSRNPPLTDLWAVAKKWLDAQGIPTP